MSASYADRRAVGAALRARQAAIARAATDAFLEGHPDWLDRYGEAARLRGEEDAAFHVQFLAGAVVANDPAAFEAYSRWTAGVLSARGIAPRYLAESIGQIRDAALDHLREPGHALVRRIAAEGIQAAEAYESPGAVDDRPSEYATERSLYLQALRAGDRRAAANIALECVRRGAPVQSVYLEVLQPVQYEIGRLWERNEISVAEEHMATAITQYVIGQLYDHLEIPEATRGNALVTGVRGELHQLGANMVADVLEADGWGVRFLGTQLPHRGVLEAIDEHEPRLIGVSATVLSNLPAVADLIEDTRRRFGDAVSIVVGGAAFRIRPDVWREMGADGFGRDLREAVSLADRLIPRTEG